MRLLALLLLAQGLPSVPQPMAVDSEPSALACTFDAALRGDGCTYEAAAGPGQPQDNGKAAADAGLRACAAAAGRDEALRRDCEHAVATASLSDACALHARLADEQGRLTPQAKACVEAVRVAVSRTARAAAVALDCCKCLSETRCTVSAAQCRTELADLMPGPSLSGCLAKACHDSCAFVAPAKAAEPPTPPAAENHADKI